MQSWRKGESLRALTVTVKLCINHTVGITSHLGKNNKYEMMDRGETQGS